jgi:predicted membrane metal-binding protein
MIKKVIWALSSGLLAGVVSYSYGDIFEKQLMEDYSNVVPTAAIFISCLIGTILATLGFWLLTKFIPKYGEFIFAFLFALLTTASLVGVLGFTFTDDSNELHQFIFYGYAMPMHFFPFLAWYVFKPLFDKK